MVAWIEHSAVTPRDWRENFLDEGPNFFTVAIGTIVREVSAIGVAQVLRKIGQVNPRTANLLEPASVTSRTWRAGGLLWTGAALDFNPDVEFYPITWRVIAYETERYRLGGACGLDRGPREFTRPDAADARCT
jgi:hypothetical protein